MRSLYMNELYKTYNQNNTITTNSSLKGFQPPRTKTLTHKCVSYLACFYLEWFVRPLKLSLNVNTFKHKVKKSFSTLLLLKKD